MPVAKSKPEVKKVVVKKTVITPQKLVTKEAVEKQVPSKEPVFEYDTASDRNECNVNLASFLHSLRQTGRTTRMLKRAAEVALHHSVIIVMKDVADAERVCAMPIFYPNTSIRVVADDGKGTYFNRETMSKGNIVDEVVVFIDHQVIESAMLEKLRLLMAGVDWTTLFTGDEKSNPVD